MDVRGLAVLSAVLFRGGFVPREWVRLGDAWGAVLPRPKTLALISVGLHFQGQSKLPEKGSSGLDAAEKLEVLRQSMALS